MPPRNANTALQLLLAIATTQIRSLAMSPGTNYVKWDQVQETLDKFDWGTDEIADCLSECTAIDHQVFLGADRYTVVGVIAAVHDCEILISSFAEEVTLEVIRLRIAADPE
jgi:hypothetical protein